MTARWRHGGVTVSPTNEGTNLMQFTYVVTVETDTREHADIVMIERIHFDEQYRDAAGVEFDYTVNYEETKR